MGVLPGWNLSGLSAEIVWEKTTFKYLSANQSELLIFFHTNLCCVIRWN